MRASRPFHMLARDASLLIFSRYSVIRLSKSSRLPSGVFSCRLGVLPGKFESLMMIAPIRPHSPCTGRPGPGRRGRAGSPILCRAFRGSPAERPVPDRSCPGGPGQSRTPCPAGAGAWSALPLSPLGGAAESRGPAAASPIRDRYPLMSSPLHPSSRITAKPLGKLRLQRVLTVRHRQSIRMVRAPACGGFGPVSSAAAPVPLRPRRAVLSHSAPAPARVVRTDAIPT